VRGLAQLETIAATDLEPPSRAVVAGKDGRVNLLRRIASLPGLRVVLLHPAVRRRVAAALAVRFALAARRTTTPLQLLLNEYVRRRGRVNTYVIKDSGVPVVMQHGRDLEALFELFERGEYEPPAELAERLSSGRVRRILDIGANVGMFSAWATGRWPGADITAFEPAPENLQVLREWARGQDRVTLVEAAAYTEPGTLHFHGGLGAGSRLTLDEAGVEVQAVDAFEHLAACDFVKMDIEGGEWSILGDPRLAELDDLVLVMEYHRVNAPSLPAQDAARSLLEAAGFAVGHTTHNHWGHGTLWAWKPALA
jgi:FkbM family methyltransferase